MNKTIRALILYLFLLSLLLPLASCAELDETLDSPPLWLNTGANRPVRESVDDATRIVRTLSRGETVGLLSLHDEWAEVLVFNEADESLEGWTLSEGLRPRVPEDGFSLATVNSPDPSARAPLRAQPRKSAKVLGKYYNGVVAHVLTQPLKGWVQVRVGDLTGYFEEAMLALDVPSGTVPSSIPTVIVSNPDTSGLNLRSAQSFRSETKATYANGRTVRVLGVTEDFVHVLTEDEKTGFMMAWGVTPQPAYADIDGIAAVPQPDGALTVVDNPGGQGARLRSRASTGSDSLGLYLNGTAVVVTSGGEYWKQVWVDGRTGWMMAKLLKGMQPEESE